jgi:hypothetical protein
MNQRRHAPTLISRGFVRLASGGTERIRTSDTRFRNSPASVHRRSLWSANVHDLGLLLQDSSVQFADVHGLWRKIWRSSDLRVCKWPAVFKLAASCSPPFADDRRVRKFRRSDPSPVRRRSPVTARVGVTGGVKCSTMPAPAGWLPSDPHGPLRSFRHIPIRTSMPRFAGSA